MSHLLVAWSEESADHPGEGALTFSRDKYALAAFNI